MLVVLTIVSCSDDNNAPEPIDTSELTITEIALISPGLSSLVEALSLADGNLASVLNGTGPFTVLAPTNDAFQALLDSNPSWNTISDIDSAVLQQVLLNHVISDEIRAADLIGLGSGYTTTNADAVGGNKMSLYFNTDTGVEFNGVASVVNNGADIIAKNGTIHVVDAVITLPTIATFATSNPNFSTLVTALTSLTPNTDFASILSSSDGDPDPFTVFAPLNSAFDAITIPADENTLTAILQHHVVGGQNITSSDLNNPGDTTAPSLQGDNLIVTLPGTGSNIANLTDGSGNSDIGIVLVDVQAVNGVIHVIDTVAIPNI